jgi:catechol 2,3-dioxygenase-like lactoylglutathione lyase family enzyme
MAKAIVCCLSLIFFISVAIAEDSEDQKEAGTPPAGFWHLSLVVNNLDLMHEFYSEIIGLEPVTHLRVEDEGVVATRQDSIRVAQLDALMGIEKTRIELRHYSDPSHTQFLELLTYPDHPEEQVDRAVNKPLGLNHLGLQVDSIDRVLSAISERGLGKVVGGPVILPEFGNHRYMFIKDPEGNLLELYEFNADTVE